MQTGFVGKGSDHLQLIKFWPSRAPGKGVCGGAKFFGSALLQPARSVCVSVSAFFHSSRILSQPLTFSRKLPGFSIFRVNSANPNISRKCFNQSEF